VQTSHSSKVSLEFADRKGLAETHGTHRAFLVEAPRVAGRIAMTNDPAGTTTIAGHLGQSWNSVPDLGKTWGGSASASLDVCRRMRAFHRELVVRTINLEARHAKRLSGLVLLPQRQMGLASQ